MKVICKERLLEDDDCINSSCLHYFEHSPIKSCDCFEDWCSWASENLSCNKIKESSQWAEIKEKER